MTAIIQLGPRGLNVLPLLLLFGMTSCGDDDEITGVGVPPPVCVHARNVGLPARRPRVMAMAVVPADMMMVMVTVRVMSRTMMMMGLAEAGVANATAANVHTASAKIRGNWRNATN